MNATKLKDLTRVAIATEKLFDMHPYVVTLWDNQINLQAHFHSKITLSAKKSKKWETKIAESGYAEISRRLCDYTITITLTE